LDDESADFRYFNGNTGILLSSVFVDPDLYRREISGLFQRSWLFISPVSWLSQAGDYVSSRMGEDEVVAWRGHDGVLRVFENLCLAGQGRLTAAARGNSEILMCECHGWHYDSFGRIAEKKALELSRTISVEFYKGLVFACHKPDASFTESVEDFDWYLDLLTDRSDSIEVFGGEALTWTVRANWKVAAQAFCGDTYRDSHADRDGASVIGNPARSEAEGFQVSTQAGSMVILTCSSVSTRSRLGPPRDSFSPTVGTLFPTLSFDWRTPSLHVWQPMAPALTRVQSFCVIDNSAPHREQEQARRAFQFQYGPAGLLSLRDVQQWEAVSRGINRRKSELNLQMGLGRRRSANIPGRIGDLISESNQRAFFEWWQRRVEQPAHSLPRRLLRIPSAPPTRS
jgi:nitrite reductase/ring-hydroxylating ferredoxin subunit